jgi:GntR family transcriptional regulator/MocR family aminotransferase
MSIERRAALLQWVRESNAWVFVDDYDSEFCYTGAPLTALAGLGHDRVGTFTRTPFASLRLAYVALPPQIVQSVVNARVAHDRFPALFMQEAVADLMTDGKLANHVRRVRRRYCEARDTVATALTNASDGMLDARVPPPYGLHLAAYLPMKLRGTWLAAPSLDGASLLSASPFGLVPFASHRRRRFPRFNVRA